MLRLGTSLFFLAVSVLAEPAPPALKAIDDWLHQPAAERSAQPPATPLTLAEARACRDRLWQFVRDEAAPAHAAELEAKVIEIDGAKLRWMERVFGKEPVSGHSLWISMHGGGGAPTRVNDSQWKNQMRLYEGLPHWMNRRDAEALPWMAPFTRKNLTPRRVIDAGWCRPGGAPPSGPKGRHPSAQPSGLGNGNKRIRRPERSR